MFLSTQSGSGRQLAKRPPLISTPSAGAARLLAQTTAFPATAKALTDEITRRRIFAIISRPGAGKSTLTEKLLRFGGAIQLTGAVKARGERRRVRSDWMAVERSTASRSVLA